MNLEQKGETIANLGRWEGDKWTWNFVWRRGQFEQETILLERFRVELEGNTVCRESVNSWRWLKCATGLYSYKELFVLFSKVNIKRVFNVPPKIIFFLWRNRLLTGDNLSARNLDIRGCDFNCIFGCHVEETISHTLFDRVPKGSTNLEKMLKLGQYLDDISLFSSCTFSSTSSTFCQFGG